jgi:hypothetical protein
MAAEQQGQREPRTPPEKWRRLPERIHPDDMVASVPADPAPPISAEPVGDPDTAWMLRYS